MAAEIQGVVHLEKQGVVDAGVLPTGAGVSVMLLPLPGKGVQEAAQKAMQEKDPETHDMILKGKRLDPLFTTIRTGDSVRFNNQDGTMHHLHAVSARHPFDVMLGKKGGESATATIEFAQEGSWYLYCTLHPSMFGQIDVVNTAYIQNLDSSNQFNFSGLVPGKWQLRATTLGNVHVLTEAEAFTASPMLELTLRLDVNPRAAEAGGNE
jgi:plastocyanin